MTGLSTASHERDGKNKGNGVTFPPSKSGRDSVAAVVCKFLPVVVNIKGKVSRNSIELRTLCVGMMQ